MRPKCILFRLDPAPIDSTILEIAKTIPWAKNCVDCQRRKDGKLEKLCYKEIA